MSKPKTPGELHEAAAVAIGMRKAQKFTLKATDDMKEYQVVLLDGTAIDAIRTAAGGFLKRFITRTFDGEEVFFESRKCTDKGVPMADVWIPQLPTNTIQALADLVSLGVETEADVVHQYKVGKAIFAQHEAKETRTGKFTRATEKTYTNKLTDEQWLAVAEAEDHAGTLTAFAKQHWLEHNQPVKPSIDEAEALPEDDEDKA